MDRPRIVGDYELLHQIGSGSFAVVWKAKHRLTGAVVAVKEIAADKLNQKLCENLMSEIEILKRTSHPNIIRLYATIQASNRIFLVLEYCAGGDLGAFIQKHGKVSDMVAKHFMRQLGAGLQVLRTNNLMHRDLKPQNLLLSTSDNNASLKIADFGFARSLQPQGMAETLCGSPLYMAPEILQSKKYDAKADLWSVGTILYQLVTGQPPFLGQSPFQLLQNIQKSNELRFPPSVARELHPECIDLCRKLLRKDPVERLSFEEFFNHSFIAEPIKHQLSNSDSEECLPPPATKFTQDEGMPFLLDEEQLLVSSPSNPIKVLSRSPKGNNDRFLEPKETHLGLTSREDVKTNGSKPITSQGSSLKAEKGGFPTTHSKGALMDSDEYVLVSAPVSSTDISSLSPSDQFTGPENQSPCKFPPKDSLPRRDSTGGISTVDPSTTQVALKSADVVGETTSFPIRLYGLHKCAETISELANEKYIARQHLEALSIQLVCLALWKEALSLEQKDGRLRTMSEGDYKLFMPFLVDSDDDGGTEGIYSSIRYNFPLAVERAEEFAPLLYTLDGDTEIPDAMDLIFQSALARGRSAAVDELMGNFADAALAYSKAALLLYFLLVEATILPSAPLILDPSDKQRLRNYIEILVTRQKLCTAQNQDSNQPPG